MTRRFCTIGAVVLATVVGGLLSSGPTLAAAQGGDAVAGEMLYQQNCAACHGDKLQGQANWRTPEDDGRLRAPPHDVTGHTWHHDDDLLFSYTKFGGKQAMAQLGIEFNSGMPGFGDQLSDQQIDDILTYIKSTWPERQRTIQAARSEAKRRQKDENQ